MERKYRNIRHVTSREQGMPSSIGVGRILGIRVDIHLSLFLIVAFLSWSLARGFLPERYPNWNTATYWSTGFVCALSLFVSVLLHEFAHSLVAIRRGYRVEGITLFLLGGVSSIASESRRAVDDFVISVVGPLSSLAIAAIIGIVAVTSGGSSPAYAAIEYVAIINLLLGLFNLLPAFPLDGGRVLRAAIWAVTGSFRRRRGSRLAADRWLACCWWGSASTKSFRDMRYREYGRRL
ncbi:MAG: hypothetical protein F4W93_01860 [Dehalococcoidia bacterium]|nr:hypothetical protein [Dehalococcoidia bacterium]